MKKFVNVLVKFIILTLAFFAVVKVAGTTTCRAVVCAVLGGIFMILQENAQTILEWVFKPLLKKLEARAEAQRMADEAKFEAAVQAALEKKLKEEAGK